ncbi:hypothetical protein DL769_006402 [Monosporascus sp. CRB-8-3]|nr:hypothetical protein DL769_006402 [Monosporascus sp. CRB-8-3]
MPFVGASWLKLLDTDQLYKLLLHMPRNRMAFRLDYGHLGSVHEQYWWCEQGKEVLVANPCLPRGPFKVS